VLHRGYIGGTDRSSLGLLVVYRRYGRRDFAHRPEACYPAAGWEITGKRSTRVPYAGKNVDAVEVAARRGDVREVVVYWFASGRRTEANYIRQQVTMALDRLRPHKYGWAFIRVNSRVTVSEEATLSDIRRFLRTASGPLFTALTRSQSRSSGYHPTRPAGRNDPAKPILEPAGAQIGR
jgi:EpsI family protein